MVLPGHRVLCVFYRLAIDGIMGFQGFYELRNFLNRVCAVRVHKYDVVIGIGESGAQSFAFPFAMVVDYSYVFAFCDFHCPVF